MNMSNIYYDALRDNWERRWTHWKGEHIYSTQVVTIPAKTL